MSSGFHVVTIEDFVANEIDPDAQHHLLDLFESAARSMLAVGGYSRQKLERTAGRGQQAAKIGPSKMQTPGLLP